MIEVTAQSIVAFAALLAAVIAIFGYIFKVYRWYQKQQEQDQKLTKLQEQHEYDVVSIKEEQRVLVYGLLACLKGLQEQGCNGPVTDAINTLEKHLNKEAHR